MTHIIELNDAGVRVADASGILVTSPGYAVVDARRLLVGDEARHRARLEPRFASNQFWHRLSMDPLPHPHPSARTLADLAHAHLSALWADAGAVAGAEVIFALPGAFEREQIALLLGIARECPFQAVGLVDTGVAATASRQTEARRVACVDGLLHEAAITIVEADDGFWRREAFMDVPNLGLAAVREAWLNLVADTFIRETRFDPLHDASTEQALFDRLDDWLALFATRAELEIELQTADAVHRISMTRARFVEKAHPRYELLADALARALPDASASQVMLSPAMAALPGLADTLSERLHMPVDVFEIDAAVRGALDHAADIHHEGEALRYVTRLRARGSSAPSANASPTPSPTARPDDAPRTSAEPSEKPSEKHKAPQSEAPAGGAHAASTERARTEASSTSSVQALRESDPDAPTHVLLDHHAWRLAGEMLEIGGPDGLAGDRYPVRLGILRRSAEGWHLQSDGPSGTLPPLAPGEPRVIGPERALVTLIRVEED